MKNQSKPNFNLCVKAIQIDLDLCDTWDELIEILEFVLAFSKISKYDDCKKYLFKLVRKEDYERLSRNQRTKILQQAFKEIEKTKLKN